MSIINVQQGEQVYVYLLCRITEERFGYGTVVEHVFTHKVQAEAALRVLKTDSEERYYIIEHLTQPHDNYK